MDHPCCAIDWEILQVDTLVQGAGSPDVCPVIHSFIHFEDFMLKKWNISQDSSFS
jgi:hypothetical protein